MTIRYYPRGGAKYLNRHAKTLLASALILAFNSAQANVLTPPIDATWDDPGQWKDQNSFYLTSQASFDEIDAKISPYIQKDEYFVDVKGENASLEITGKTYLRSVSNTIIGDEDDDIGTYAFHAKEGAAIRLLGDIDITVVHAVPSGQQLDAIGANGFYAQEGGIIEIGSEGTTSRAWVLAAKPDVLSAKNGGTIIINSVHNMFVGSIDTLGIPYAILDPNQNPADGFGTVKGTFSGSDSYWFGDEQSWLNVKLIEGSEKIKKLFNKAQQAATEHEKIELIFEDGAQWSYLNVNDVYSKTIYESNVTIQFTPKRISSITLRNRGIINLFDEDLLHKWDEIGLSNKLENPVVNHDYVRIGDLKGSDGIFRLDLDSDHPEESDMIFIEGTSETTQTRHWIEPYHPSQLMSVSADNTLTFALTQKDANNVTFADKMNIYGKTLYDYELYVNSDPIDEKDLAILKEQIKSNYTDFGEFDDDDSSADQSYREDYLGGTEWFINRVVVSKSAATVGVNNAGWAAYDAIMQMDRRDRRLRETAFVDSNSNDGLWVRMQYGRLGAEDAYKSDTTTVHVGYERQTSDNNRFGVSVSYMDGSPDFENLKGGGDLERYEIAVYDTLTFGNHYLDFVGRFGHLSSDFSSSRSASSISTQGEFSTNYFGVSAEYGYTLKSAAGFFAEPQLQMQATRLEGYNYGLQRDMSVDVEQETALVGRAGLRLGKHFAGERSSGEIYVRGDLLHQFTDGQFGHIRDLEDVEVLHWGDAGTWTNFGVGGYYQFANKFSMQLDLEKSASGEQLDAWMVSGHLVYNF